MPPSVHNTSTNMSETSSARYKVVRKRRAPTDGVKAADGDEAEMQALLNTFNSANISNSNMAIVFWTLMRFISSWVSLQNAFLQTQPLAKRYERLWETLNVHGQTLPEIINCKERGSSVGGCATVTLSGQEAERRFETKAGQKRAREPVFTAALELHNRSKWVYHENVKESS